MDLKTAVETSVFLAEKHASDDSQAMREKCALADFLAFGMIKHAGVEELWPLIKKPLAWGAGVGLPALGVGHALISDARSQGEDLVRDARNQALMTAAGVGGMQALGGMLQNATAPKPSYTSPSPQDMQMRMAADVMMDDMLEAACATGTEKEKRAALVHLIVHRGDAMRAIRSLLR